MVAPLVNILDRVASSGPELFKKSARSVVFDRWGFHFGSSGNYQNVSMRCKKLSKIAGNVHPFPSRSLA